MDLSGIIFVVLAVAWAVYLIPKALKRHDEVARTRSIDRFSTAMRVLARREPVNGRDARLVLSPARPAGNPRVLLPTSAAVEAVMASRTEPAAVPPAGTGVVRTAVRVHARRAAARAAARRRRRILTFLLLCTAVTSTVAVLGYAPWWAPVLPGGLTLLFLVLCRTQVRRESLRDFEVLAGEDREAVDSVSVVPRRAVRVEAQDGTPRGAAAAAALGDGVAEFDDAEDTVGIPAELLDAIVVPTEDGGTLWDPLPVTLPTYVTKPKARRTVRTIDLGEPGTWTSGRTAEDAEIVAQAEAQSASDAESADPAKGDQQRAVGS